MQKLSNTQLYNGNTASSPNSIQKVSSRSFSSSGPLCSLRLSFFIINPIENRDCNLVASFRCCRGANLPGIAQEIRGVEVQGVKVKPSVSKHSIPDHSIVLAVSALEQRALRWHHWSLFSDFQFGCSHVDFHGLGQIFLCCHQS